MLNKYIIIVFIAFIPVVSLANNEMVKNHVPQAELVGKGKLSKFIWDVYDAELYASKGQFSWDDPFALRIKYLRDISKEQIADTTIQEIKKQGFHDYQKLKEWKYDLLNAIPDVQKGTEITGIYSKDGNTIFYISGDKARVIKDKDFGIKFFNIWLDEESSEKRLRKKLLGLI